MTNPADIFSQHCANYTHEVRVAAGIAEEAGVIALRYHGTDLVVEHKPGNEPVTIADQECSAHIVSRLQAEFPNDTIISEENEDDRRRLSAERVWYVDPIDGTKDFIRGDSTYCIMLGLCVSHRPVLGVIYQPNHQSLVFASEGSGAWSLRKNLKSRLQASSTTEPGDARLILSSVGKTADVERIRECLGIHQAESIGSIGMKICTIAIGGSDLYVNPATHCSSWDTCAPEAILGEAGGQLSDLYGHTLRYDQEDSMRHTRGLVASNGSMHAAVLDELRRIFPDPEQV